MACCMTILESMVLEKLFQEDQPMGGGVAGICFMACVSGAGVAGAFEFRTREKLIEAAMAAAGRTNLWSISASKESELLIRSDARTQFIPF